MPNHFFKTSIVKNMLEIWQESLGVAFGGTGLPLISSLLFDRGYHGHMDFNHEGKKTGYFFKQFLKMAKKTLTGSGLWPQTSRLLYRCCPIWAIQLLINLDGGSPIKVVAGVGGGTQKHYQGIIQHWEQYRLKASDSHQQYFRYWSWIQNLGE